MRFKVRLFGLLRIMFLLQFSLWTVILLLKSVAQSREVWETNTSKAKVHAYHPGLDQGRKEYPGMKMRLSKEGINYLNTIAARVVEKEIPKMKIPDMSQKVPEGKGAIQLKNIKIKSFKPGTSWIDLIPPNKVAWNMKDLDITLTGDMSGNYLFVVMLPLSGMLEITATKINFKVTSAMESNPDGSAKIYTSDCVTKIGAMDIFVHNGGIVGAGINLLKGEAIRLINPTLEKELCRMTRSFIDKDLSKRIAQFPVKIPLSATKNMDLLLSMTGKAKQTTPAPKPAFLREYASRDMMKIDLQHSENLWLDYRLVRDPYCSTDFIETQHQGEVSWLGEGHTPFGPAMLYEPTSSGKRRMFYFYLSDFIANSLLYHAYRNRMLRFRITPATPKIGNFMTTQCNTGDIFSFCLGDIIPGLAEAYPNHTTEMLLSPTRAPALIFYQRNNGTVVMDIKGVLFIFVRMPDRKVRQVLMMDADVRAKSKVWMNVEKRKIEGEVNFDKFEFTVRRTSLVGLDDPWAVKDLQEFYSDIMEGIANNFLAQGFPVPLIPGVKIVKPELSIYKRAMRVGADIEVEEEAVKGIAKMAIAQGLGGNR